MDFNHKAVSSLILVLKFASYRLQRAKRTALGMCPVLTQLPREQASPLSSLSVSRLLLWPGGCFVTPPGSPATLLATRRHVCLSCPQVLCAAFKNLGLSTVQYVCFLFKKDLCVNLEGNTVGGERERLIDPCSICWFTSHRTGPGQSQDPQLPLGVSWRCQGPRHLGLLLFFCIHELLPCWAQRCLDKAQEGLSVSGPQQ